MTSTQRSHYTKGSSTRDMETAESPLETPRSTTPMVQDSNDDAASTTSWTRVAIPVLVTAGFFLVAVLAFAAFSLEGCTASPTSTPTPPPHATFTAFNPDPAVLKWTSGTPAPGSIVSGELTVHLDPSDAESPTLTLEVIMRMANENSPTPTPALIIPGSGPGVSASIMPPFFAMFPNYNAFSISQRGIGPYASPNFRCNNSVLPKEDAKRKNESFKISDFTDCPCALPDGMPQFEWTWADINHSDENEVRSFFDQMRKWTTRCYQAEKFQMFQGDRHWNFLNYVGTNLLAQDYEQVRRAINADTLHLWGVSYGTLVASTYATMYPKTTGRVFLDAALTPSPQKMSFVEGIAVASQTTVDELLSNCARNSDTCTLQDPEVAFARVMKSAAAGSLTADTKKGQPFVLKPGMLQGALQNYLIHGSMWPSALDIIKSLSSSDPDVVKKTVKSILDNFCVVKGTPTWFNYGVCVGPYQTMEEENDPLHLMPHIDGLAVLGQDFVGRYLVGDAFRAWSTASEKFSPLALGAYVGLSSLLLWPAVPAPVPPIGNPSLQVLVMGELYDPSTSYMWSQQMSTRFPAGALVTYQGLGHTLLNFGGAAQAEMNACMSIGTNFLNGMNLQTGEPAGLPRDGYNCRSSTPIKVG